nr:coiled coil domain containing protein 149 [Echinococcus granulosus]
MDESIYANLDSLSNELNVTKLQLSSKRQAIVILTQQLEDAKKEAYQFKLMAEQVQERYKNLKQVLGSEAGSPTFGTSSQRNLFINLKVKLNESEMHSRILETELSNLRKRNAELMDDIALLKKSAGFQHSRNLELMAKEKSSFETQGRESLIKQLELKTLECQRIKRDLELCNEEKQEILSELIHWKKSDETESNEETNSIGADTVFQENKLLSRQISRLEADKKLLMQTLAKYQMLKSVTGGPSEDGELA